MRHCSPVHKSLITQQAVRDSGFIQSDHLGGLQSWAAIIGGRGDAFPQNFAWVDANASVPQRLLLLVNTSSVQNAYSSEELNGLLYYQNSIFFQLQGGFARLTP